MEATGGCTKVQEPSADGCILAEGCQADARALLCEGVTALSNGLAMARGDREGGASSSTDADGPDGRRGDLRARAAARVGVRSGSVTQGLRRAR